MTRPRMFRLTFFIWIIIPLLLWLTYVAFGLPHMIWEYSWIDQGQGMNPYAERNYTHCRFIGPYGLFDQGPINGRCGLVRFFKEGSAQ